MSIGYEGYVKVGGVWTLGTGASASKGIQRIDSSGGYGGKITGAGVMGVGSPHIDDWTAWDGSCEFELTDGVFSVLKAKIVTSRDDPMSITFSSRTNNEQTFSGAYWNSINLTTSEASLVTGTVGFVAMDRTTYTYGTDTVRSAGLTGGLGLVPIPYWNTSIGSYKFIEWSIDFAQDVVKFFACNKAIGPQAPAYYGVGPVTATLTGSYIYGGEMDDSPGDLTVTIGAGSITLLKAEVQSSSDDVAQGNSLTPIKVVVNAYDVG